MKEREGGYHFKGEVECSIKCAPVNRSSDPGPVFVCKGRRRVEAKRTVIEEEVVWGRGGGKWWWKREE